MVGKLALGFVGKLDDFLRAAAQQHAVVGQNHAVLAAAEELDAKLIFQLHELARKRGLCHVQQRCCLCDIFLPCHSEKIAQNAQFHTDHLKSIITKTGHFCIAEMPGLLKSWLF